MRLWKNATNQTDPRLLEVTKDIADVNKSISELSRKITEANSNITKCETEKAGLFHTYNCKGNTGKTLREWERIRDNGQPGLSALRQELQDLTSQKRSILDTIKNEAVAAGATADAAEEYAETQEAKANASAAQAKNVGLWVGIGVLGIGALALIYMKVIKKKK